VKAPAEVLRDGKARAKAAIEAPVDTNARAKAAVAELAAAQEDMATLAVPMTLADVCGIISVDCKPDNFAVTALESLAGQVSALQCIVEKEEVDAYEGYRLLENLSERMRLAARVTSWLQSETREAAATLPGVAP
jgi:hypothetical protein